MGGLLRLLALAYAPWPIRPRPAVPGEDEDEPIPKQPDPDSQAAAAAYGAAVEHLINRPDTIRARAQVSATISAAVAAALAALAPLTGLGSREDWLQLLVALAIVSWLVSLWRYILVIAFSYQNAKNQIEIEAEEKSKSTDKLELHLYKFVGYAARMRLKVERGTAATQMALLLTLAAAVALSVEGVVAGEKSLDVSLTTDGARAVSAVCGQSIDDPLREVQAKPDDLKLSVVPLKLPKGSCGTDAVVVHVRRSWIGAARSSD